MWSFKYRMATCIDIELAVALKFYHVNFSVKNLNRWLWSKEGRVVITLLNPQLDAKVAVMPLGDIYIQITCLKSCNISFVTRFQIPYNSPVASVCHLPTRLLGMRPPEVPV